MRLFILVLVVLLSAEGVRAQVSTTEAYQTAAFKAAAWLQAAALPQADGTLAWPADPLDPETVHPDLYNGSAGVVLFFLELYRATSDARYLGQARAGADYLIAAMPDTLRPGQNGLYTGVAGHGFVLEETYRLTQEERYRQAAWHAVELLKRDATPTSEGGVTWGGVTDIISGSAGTGLFLLYAHHRMAHPDALPLATRAARTLLAAQQDAPGGIKWAMSADFPRLMPNFSHGTAGVAYFLTELYRTTGDKALLEAALAGAHYLQAIQTDEGLIFHHEPEGEDLFYLSWCHGPPGTARLYYRLWQVTEDPQWMDALHVAARSTMHTGIPDQETDGFWNNVGQCCGSAGVAEFFYAMYRLTGEDDYRAFADHVTDNVLARATATADGLQWIQAEHRVRPDLLIAQTGYMQGAAGIGSWLLHRATAAEGPSSRIPFPDSPWE